MVHDVKLINIEGVELNVDDIEKWILMKKPPRYSFLDLRVLSCLIIISYYLIQYPSLATQTLSREIFRQTVKVQPRDP